jgi:phage-related protein (TIGR01555 family)
MARLYGGSGIIIGADVADPSQPLRPNRIGRGGLKYLTVVSRFDLSVTEIDRDPASTTFGEPKFYTLSSLNGGAVNIHPSRVLRFTGSDRLDIDFNADGWGDSVLMAMYDAVHHAALSQAGIAEMIHEAKVDVIKVPNLGSALSTEEGTKALTTRFTNANILKSINNMLLLDSQEEWDRKQTSFAALPDILDRYLQIVSGAADIPATRLLGQAPRGLNATGDSDMRNYYDMVVAMREQAIGRQLAYLDQILWIDAIGSIPKDVYPEWEPLWQLTPGEKATIALQKAQATNIYGTLNIMPEEALRAGVQNQLIEDGTYPGLEAAIEQLRLAGVDPLEPPEQEDPQSDNPTADRSLSYYRH